MTPPANPGLAPQHPTPDRSTEQPSTRQRSTKQSALALLGFLLAVLVTAVVGATASSDAKEKYAALDQPSWAPPSWLFGPAWGVLYVLIAVAGWLVWRRFGFDRAVQLWVVQLVLNALWSPLFFGAELYWVAFVDICVLMVAVSATIAQSGPAIAWRPGSWCRTCCGRRTRPRSTSPSRSRTDARAM